MRQLLVMIAAGVFAAVPAYADWSAEFWKGKYDLTVPDTTGDTVTAIRCGESAFLQAPNTILDNDLSNPIEFTCQSGTVVCVDTHLGQLAAGGSLVLGAYSGFAYTSQSVTNNPGLVVAQNASGDVALASGTPCESFAPGWYVFSVGTAPGAEDAAIHARGK